MAFIKRRPIMSEITLESKNCQSVSTSVTEKKKYFTDRSKYIHSFVGIAFMFGFPLLNPIEPITEIGMHILAIFIGMVYLWSTVNSIWPSILGLLLMTISGFATMTEVAVGAFGADIAVLMLLSMVFFGGVEYAGCTQYMARWFVTRKIIDGRPYIFLFIFFLGSYFLSGLTEFICQSQAIQARMLAYQIYDLAKRNILQSMARILYSIFCYEKTKGSQEIPLSINITHEVLANMLGAHRVTVTKNINYVKELGIIDYKYEKIMILDPERLKKMAEDDF